MIFETSDCRSPQLACMHRGLFVKISAIWDQHSINSSTFHYLDLDRKSMCGRSNLMITMLSCNISAYTQLGTKIESTVNHQGFSLNSPKNFI